MLCLFLIWPVFAPGRLSGDAALGLVPCGGLYSPLVVSQGTRGWVWCRVVVCIHPVHLWSSLRGRGAGSGAVWWSVFTSGRLSGDAALGLVPCGGLYSPLVVSQGTRRWVWCRVVVCIHPVHLWSSLRGRGAGSGAVWWSVFAPGRLSGDAGLGLVPCGGLYSPLVVSQGTRGWVWCRVVVCIHPWSSLRGRGAGSGAVWWSVFTLFISGRLSGDAALGLVPYGGLYSPLVVSQGTRRWVWCRVVVCIPPGRLSGDAALGLVPCGGLYSPCSPLVVSQGTRRWVWCRVVVCIHTVHLWSSLRGRGAGSGAVWWSVFAPGRLSGDAVLGLVPCGGLYSPLVVSQGTRGWVWCRVVVCIRPWSSLRGRGAGSGAVWWSVFTPGRLSGDAGLGLVPCGGLYSPCSSLVVSQGTRRWVWCRVVVCIRPWSSLRGRGAGSGAVWWSVFTPGRLSGDAALGLVPCGGLYSPCSPLVVSQGTRRWVWCRVVVCIHPVHLWSSLRGRGAGSGAVWWSVFTLFTSGRLSGDAALGLVPCGGLYSPLVVSQGTRRWVWCRVVVCIHPVHLWSSLRGRGAGSGAVWWSVFTLFTSGRLSGDAALGLVPCGGLYSPWSSLRGRGAGSGAVWWSVFTLFTSGRLSGDAALGLVPCGGLYSPCSPLVVSQGTRRWVWCRVVVCIHTVHLWSSLRGRGAGSGAVWWSVFTLFTPGRLSGDAALGLVLCGGLYSPCSPLVVSQGTRRWVWCRVVVCIRPWSSLRGRGAGSGAVWWSVFTLFTSGRLSGDAALGLVPCGGLYSPCSSLVVSQGTRGWVWCRVVVCIHPWSSLRGRGAGSGAVWWSVFTLFTSGRLSGDAALGLVPCGGLYSPLVVSQGTRGWVWCRVVVCIHPVHLWSSLRGRGAGSYSPCSSLVVSQGTRRWVWCRVVVCIHPVHLWSSLRGRGAGSGAVWWSVFILFTSGRLSGDAALGLVPCGGLYSPLVVSQGTRGWVWCRVVVCITLFISGRLSGDAGLGLVPCGGLYSPLVVSQGTRRWVWCRVVVCITLFISGRLSGAVWWSVFTLFTSGRLSGDAALGLVPCGGLYSPCSSLVVSQGTRRWVWCRVVVCIRPWSSLRGRGAGSGAVWWSVFTLFIWSSLRGRGAGSGAVWWSVFTLFTPGRLSGDAGLGLVPCSGLYSPGRLSGDAALGLVPCGGLYSPLVVSQGTRGWVWCRVVVCIHPVHLWSSLRGGGAGSGAVWWSVFAPGDAALGLVPCGGLYSPLVVSQGTRGWVWCRVVVCIHPVHLWSSLRERGAGFGAVQRRRLHLRGPYSGL